MKNEKKTNRRIFFNDIIDRKEKYDVFNEKIYKTFLELAGINDLPSGFKILDVDCGTGARGIRIASLGYKVTGVDTSTKMIGAASRFARIMKVDFRPIRADVQKMPFKNRSFDYIFFGFALYHIPHISLALKGISRCLKNSGKIILIEPNGVNPIRRISNILGKIINLTFGTKYSTPGERSLLFNNISENLVKYKFGNIKILLFFNLDEDVKGQMWFLLKLRNYLLKIAHILFPQHMGATDFIITAEKNNEK